MNAAKYVLGDVDEYMIKLHNMLNTYARNPQRFFSIVKTIEEKYGFKIAHIEQAIILPLI